MKSNFFHLLTLLLIHEKLAGNIDWTWWWVLSPLVLGLFVFISVKAAEDNKKT